MDLKRFVTCFEEAFEGITPGSFKPGTEFKSLEQWDSVTVLNILALVDAEFDVQLARKEILQCATVQDLYVLVMAKKV